MVALISCGLSKATSKTAKKNGLIAVIIIPLKAIPWPEWGLSCRDDGYHGKQQLPEVIGLLFP